jgi:hypothetical protein
MDLREHSAGEELVKHFAERCVRVPGIAGIRVYVLRDRRQDAVLAERLCYPAATEPADLLEAQGPYAPGGSRGEVCRT